MIITDIEKQKNNDKRYSVFIDNKFVFGLEDIDIFNFKLKINEEISSEKYNTILEHCVLSKARNKAIKFLGFKARTEKEVFDKLLDEEYSEDVIEKTLEYLKKYDYINDETYARNFIKEKFNLRGYGCKRLSYELKLKGIKGDIIDEVIFELKDEEEIDENSMATELLRKKIKGETNMDYKLKQRLYGFLARKGYNSSVIKYAFNEVLQEDLEC